jgi:hypothetical protein
LRINSPDELQMRIAQFQALHTLPGLETRESRRRFAEKLCNSEKINAWSSNGIPDI